MIRKSSTLLFVFFAVATSLTASAVTRKYHPGHYVSMYRADGPTEMLEVMKPGVVGIQRRYRWRDLETSKGVYDFSRIQTDLDFLAGQGMRLIVFIEDKTFKPVKPAPAYMNNYTVANEIGGYTVRRWDPFAVTRMKALITALGQRFDANPYFEGIGLQETALGLSDSVLTTYGYTPEKYRDALINVIKSATVSLPTSRVFWFMNFFPWNQDYIASVATAVAPYGVIMGGPDVLPQDALLLQHTYPFYTQFYGTMKLFGSMQYDSYRHRHKPIVTTKFWTMDEMFRFARDSLHVNYIIWNRTYRAVPLDAYQWLDAIPVVGANPTFNTN